VIVVTFALALFQATNQSPDAPQPPIEIEETVVVTATRSDKRIQDEPLRVEVIDREEIEEKALMTPGSVAMLLGETTGLRVQVTGPSIGAANVRIQGLRGRYAQLLADGLPLYGVSGDSFSLLQVPPLDLAQVEVIKGAASALYGPAALGGVINLVSRRARVAEREALINFTTQQGADFTFWLAEPPQRGWSWTLLSGFHGQPERDLDEDEWVDLAGYKRAVVRPRVSYESASGTTVFLTSGFIGEDRKGGSPAFLERLDTRRGDLGAVARWVTAGAKVVALRGSWSRLGQDHTFGGIRERGARSTGFGEISMSGLAGAHTWVIGGAYQQDRYAPRDVTRFAYRFSSPAVFVQDQMTLGSRAAISASARLDVHNEYGVLASPRVSLLTRPADGWTLRVSAGGGSFTPTPFTEETDEAGLSHLAPLVDLEAERAWGASADATWSHGSFEATATLFGSRIQNPVQLTYLVQAAVVGQPPYRSALLNAPSPTNTWGTELLARLRRGPFIVMTTHGFTHSTEFDPNEGRRRDVPLTPRHAASFNVMWEDDEIGRAGFEVYYIGEQPLDENPYRARSKRHVLWGTLFERRVGRVRLFLNVENIGDVRQTKFDPLVRPVPLPDGRRTVEAWGPLDGRVVNGGVRFSF
jgi:outer membrane receptor for ferrienterochelin and colicins